MKTAALSLSTVSAWQNSQSPNVQNKVTYSICFSKKLNVWYCKRQAYREWQVCEPNGQRKIQKYIQLFDAWMQNTFFGLAQKIMTEIRTPFGFNIVQSNWMVWQLLCYYEEEKKLLLNIIVRLIKHNLDQ